jgi:phosphoglycolate phosphatase-like HAD superfamily hydrolase
MKFSHAIFDFDGTLTKLTINWPATRKYLKVTTISDIWKFDHFLKKQALEYLRDLELKSVTSELLIPQTYIAQFENYAVLTNNSEKSVELFFELLESEKNIVLSRPSQILGRESLNGFKEDKLVFKNSINKILLGMRISMGHNIIYIGDQDYEIQLAKENGIEAIHVAQFLKNQNPK